MDIENINGAVSCLEINTEKHKKKNKRKNKVQKESENDTINKNTESIKINKRKAKKNTKSQEISTNKISFQEESLKVNISQDKSIQSLDQVPITVRNQSIMNDNVKSKTEKSKEQIMAEREAKKLAKQLAKKKPGNIPDVSQSKEILKNPNMVIDSNKFVPVKITQDITIKSTETTVTTVEYKEKDSTSNVQVELFNHDKKISNDSNNEVTEKTREQVIAEREAKKLAKLNAKSKIGKTENISDKIQSENITKNDQLKKSDSDIELSKKMDNLHITDEQQQPQNKAKAQTKAERRAIQEAQRALKAKTTNDKNVKTIKKPELNISNVQDLKVSKDKPTIIEKNANTKPIVISHKVKLFSHLYEEKLILDCPNNIPPLHPAVIKLGVQYAYKTVVGSNARCIAFLGAIKEVINDYVTPPQKEFSRCLEKELQKCITFLHKCRPISVSMSNALKHIKRQLTQITTEEKELESKDKLCDSIDTYIRDQIDKAAQAISSSVQEKISNGDVILTFGCSSLIQHILFEAYNNKDKVDFRVIVVDARPLNEGREMLRRLDSLGIKCTFILINAVAFIMPEVTKVMMGAHALLANGYVMSRAGTAQIAMIAKSFNVPVLVCCETHKFSERVQTDAFVYNEIGDPDDLILKSGTLENNKKNYLANWQTIPHLTPLHLYYDVTPPELVTAVVTELAILPCTSVPVILRIKPTEIGY